MTDHTYTLLLPNCPHPIQFDHKLISRWLSSFRTPLNCVDLWVAVDQSGAVYLYKDPPVLINGRVSWETAPKSAAIGPVEMLLSGVIGWDTGYWQVKDVLLSTTPQGTTRLDDPTLGVL